MVRTYSACEMAPEDKKELIKRNLQVKNNYKIVERVITKVEQSKAHTFGLLNGPLSQKSRSDSCCWPVPWMKTGVFLLNLDP